MDKRFGKYPADFVPLVDHGNLVDGQKFYQVRNGVGGVVVYAGPYASKLEAEVAMMKGRTTYGRWVVSGRELDEQTRTAAAWAAELTADPCISYWLKDALAALLHRDPLDAQNDAELLARVMQRHAAECLGRS